MLERIANSRTFVSFVLAGVTGLMLFTLYPFPQGNLYLQYVALRDPLVYSVLAGSYTLFLFTTPVLHLLRCLLGDLRIEFCAEAETEAESPSAVSRPKIQGRSVPCRRRDSSPDKNHSRQRPAMADDSRKRIVYRHRSVRGSWNGKNNMLYASICRAAHRIQS